MLRIDTAEVFQPLLAPARYKGAWGGRGSGKSHFFASAVVEHCLLHPGAKVVAIREIQKTLAQSAKAVIEQKIQDFIGSANDEPNCELEPNSRTPSQLRGRIS